MPVYVALLRAVNVGGTGLLPMKELVRLAVGLGFREVRTYIQSGNVVFGSDEAEPVVREALEQALAAQMGKPVGVVMRSGAALRATLAANPFPAANPAQVGVVLLADPVPPDFLERLVVPGPEEVRIGDREIFIHYPNGMGRSTLKLPKLGLSTTRNLNTVAKLAAMASETTG